MRRAAFPRLFRCVPMEWRRRESNPRNVSPASLDSQPVDVVVSPRVLVREHQARLTQLSDLELVEHAFALGVDLHDVRKGRDGEVSLVDRFYYSLGEIVERF